MFWIVAGLIAVAVLVPIIRTLTARRTENTEEDAAEVEVCRQQLAELERDLDAGLVSAADAAESRAAIERRLLEADEERRHRPPAARGRRSVAVIAVALTPVYALGLYVWLGHPDKTQTSQTDRQMAAGTKSGAASPAAAGNSAPSLEELAGRLEERLKKTPGDPRGWGLLGRTYSVLGEYTKAAGAYREAVALQPDVAELQSGLGEALALSANGQVTPEALAAFKRANALDPSDSAARFYLGMADYQRGKFRAALDAWVALAKDAPPDAPWLGDLRQQITALAGELGIDPKSVLPETSSPDRTANAADEIKRLADRLQQSPKDYEGWIRLARLRAAAGDKAGAKSAIDAGLQAFPEAPFVRRRLERTAGELGLAETGAATAERRGPSGEDVRAAAALSDKERRSMIEGMVSGLAARLEANPDDPEGWRMLARSYRVLGEMEKSVEARRRLAELRPQDVSAQSEYALARVQLDEANGGRNSEKTVAALRRVIRLDEDNARARLHLGKAADQRGERSKAQEHWRRMVGQLPESSPLRQEAEALLKAQESSRN